MHIEQQDGDLYADTIKTTSMDNGDWKILLNEAMPNGGNYTLSLECPDCASPDSMDTLYNVTFGDVYYCAGQSNMELDMHFTFSRNQTYDAINEGKYSNIRYMTMNELDTSNVTFVVPPKTNPANEWQIVRPEITNISLSYSLDKFSAACWYFGMFLYVTCSITLVHR